MKEIKYFRTYSHIGTEVEKRGFESVELAKSDALNDRKNSNFHLYEVTMIFDGKITERQRYLGQIVCGKDLEMFEEKENTKKI